MKRLIGDIRQSLLITEINRAQNLPFILTLMFSLSTAELWRSSHHVILLCLYTFSVHIGNINEADLI